MLSTKYYTDRPYNIRLTREQKSKDANTIQIGHRNYFWTHGEIQEGDSTVRDFRATIIHDDYMYIFIDGKLVLITEYVQQAYAILWRYNVPPNQVFERNAFDKETDNWFLI